MFGFPNLFPWAYCQPVALCYLLLIPNGLALGLKGQRVQPKAKGEANLLTERAHTIHCAKASNDQALLLALSSVCVLLPKLLTALL